MSQTEYIAVVQCHIVMEKCSGYFCEKAFHERKGGFSIYPHEQPHRILYLTCGGCCGRAVHRKLSELRRSAEKKEGLLLNKIAVHLATCITHDNYHGPKCPHLDYLQELIASKLKFNLVHGTTINDLAESRRNIGMYHG